MVVDTMATKEKSFEESLIELEQIVKDLEQGNVPLDDAITKFNEAMKIAKICNDKLTKAEESVNKILNKEGTLEDFKVE
jgi:exodeoxyribonuclease VII small subunit